MAEDNGMNDTDHKDITAVDILNKIEKDVNDGCFDKELYRNDIKNLKGQVSELSLLRNTLCQLKDHLPEYTCDVEQIQDVIESMECEVSEMVDKEVNKAVRFNESFGNLFGMISGSTSSPAGEKIWKDKKESKDSFEYGCSSHTPKNSVVNNKDTINKIKSNDILRQMLNLVEQQWVTEADFDQLPSKLGVEELTAKIFIMTKIVGLVRLMPEEMFNNKETKQNMLASSQESLDGFIEEEAEEEVEGLLDVELGFGVVGEVIGDLNLMSSNSDSGKLINSASAEGPSTTVPD
ncbi:MAG: TyeA family type III secretion system gatekeeper subunit [Candidatus Endonucleobacter sp. (ex Gigantidas childressi)]|nr:TyeA family type III secretion system gatekeeper subunit [Candidatus Endonucleobacter sp. (ex Gigantidas childressi)]